MAQKESARAGYFKGHRLEVGLRYAYRPEYVPLLMDYLGARANSRILEVGCGSGYLARLIAGTLEGVSVMGLDTDQEMLDLAVQMAAQADLAERLTWSQGDGLGLPFADDSFDLVTSHRLL